MRKVVLIAGCVALLAECAAVALGQSGQWPDIGILMDKSRDRQYVSSGCPLKWDATQKLFKCASTVQLTGTVVQVTATAGYTTNVSNASVEATSRVSCGCEGGAGTASYASCNDGGRWLARLRVSSVSDGAFTLAHGYAIGDETLVCVIEG